MHCRSHYDTVGVVKGRNVPVLGVTHNGQIYVGKNGVHDGIHFVKFAMEVCVDEQGHIILI